MMKRVMLALFAALLLVGSSGCCCFWHNVHQLKDQLHCNGCGQGYGGDCGGGHCDGGCGGHCDGGCDDGCGGKVSGGPYHHGFPYRSGHCKMEGALGCFDWGWGCNNKCSIFGCSSHYLDPNGACYGAYCGNCCEKSGCGPMYWGDAFNVPRTTE